jgi:hypothetical protein
MKFAYVALAVPVFVLPSMARAHTFEVPSTVQARVDGSFSYQATFTAGSPVDVAGEGFESLVNASPPQSHGDAFCMFGVEAGQTQIVAVDGRLNNPMQPGQLRAWFAPCDEPTLSGETTVLPGLGSSSACRFEIGGHPPIVAIETRTLFAEGGRYRGTAVLELDQGSRFDVPLTVRARERPGRRLVYRMRSASGAKSAVQAWIVVGPDSSVRRARIIYRGNQRVRVPDPTAIHPTAACGR